MNTAHLRSSRIITAGIIVLALCTGMMGCNGCKNPDIFDGSASLLNVTCAVIDNEEVPADGKVIAVIQAVYNGATVQMGSTMQVSCNGVPMTWNGLLFAHAERVPIQPVGGSYVFKVIHAGVTTTATVTVPARPVFAAPTTAGATLARTSSFAIHYVADGGTAVRGNASDGTHTQNNSQADTGVHGGLDVSAFTAGAGSLSLVRTLEWVVSGTGFQSAKAKYDTGKAIAITWS
jgi:hypothetical protein